MNKMYKDNGLLSEHGQVVTSPVKLAVYKLLWQDEEIKQMDESQLRVLGGVLQKIVADQISDRIQHKKEVAKNLAAMEDAEFERLLKKKYGDRWMLVSLEPEELDRVSQDNPCTGHNWRDEFGNEAFTHDEYTYCPVHDKK